MERTVQRTVKGLLSFIVSFHQNEDQICK